ncbi:membrane hypothetical protein [metagenome]|uniref:PNPLA domain-containing protein n=1 Tax=metagenome TaxID=256318 RepID=A0A2P2C5J2_9ZZZZ
MGQTQPPVPAQFAKPGAYVAALAGLLLAMNELSMLSAGFLDLQGEAWTFHDLLSPGVWDQRAGWNAALTPDRLSEWQGMFAVYLGLYVIFVVTAAVGLWKATGNVVRWFVLPVASAAVVEIVAAAILALLRCSQGGCLDSPWVDAVAWITIAKWGLLGLLLLALAVAFLWHPLAHLGRALRIVRAVYIQRFSLLAFLPIALLAVVPGTRLTDMFDQLPDVQRQWLDGGAGLWHAACAGAMHLGVLLPAIFLLGRLRADWATRRVAGEGRWPWLTQAGERRQQNLHLWLIGPVVLGALAAFSAIRDPGSVVWGRLLAFCAVPLVVYAGSWLLRSRCRPGRRLPGAVPAGYAQDVMAVGDILAVASVSLAGLGTVRALTAPAAISVAQGDLLGAWPGLLALLGVALAIATWPIAARVLAKIHDLSAAPDSSPWSWLSSVATPGVNVVTAPDQDRYAVDGKPQTLARTVLMAFSVVGFLAVSLAPRWAAGAFGALAVTIFAMAVLIVMVGVIVAYTQEREKPELFQLPLATLAVLGLIVVCLLPQDLGGWVAGVRVGAAVFAVVVLLVGLVVTYRRRGEETIRTAGFGPSWTPVVPLFLLAVLLANLVGSPSDVHPVAHTPSDAERPTMAEVFATWVDEADACTSSFTFGPRELEVRPMLMMAAEGGGLRASYWTAAALDEIAAAGDGCGSHSTLFSGGASGGAFGLTLARFTDDPLASVKAIAGSKALGAASMAMVGGDLLASATGIRLESSTPGRASDRAWLDRAGMMETVWADQVGLPAETNFLSSAPSGDVTGQLVLTSTVVRSACRALVSQVTLGADRTTCPGSTGPRSFDLLGAYGCLDDVPALTAGLLASRFPYVTPSGSVDGCGDRSFLQLVDGGYTDNTGLGTIRNLAGQWAPLVQAHNKRVLEGADEPLVLPVVVYLENGTGSAFGVSPQDAADAPTDDPDDQGPAPLDWAVTPESLVPPVTGYRARDHKVTATPSLQRAVGLTWAALCTTSAPRCGALKRELAAWSPQVFVVHQSPQPTVSAPLGWVLSQASQDDLDSDLAEQLATPCPELPLDPGCRAGYANLSQLVALLGR